jgi:hypothetical protein
VLTTHPPASWYNKVEGKSAQQRGMEEAAKNGEESSHSAHDNEWINEMKFTLKDPFNSI